MDSPIVTAILWVLVILVIIVAGWYFGYYLPNKQKKEDHKWRVERALALARQESGNERLTFAQVEAICLGAKSTSGFAPDEAFREKLLEKYRQGDPYEAYADDL